MHGESARAGFRVERVRLTCRRLRDGAGPIRFVHLSDLHMRATGPLHERLLAAVDDAEPHFVVLTGDLVSHLRGTWDALWRLLDRMTPRHRVLACRGNWEARGGPRPSVLRQWMAEHGAELLVNESRLVPAGPFAVRVAGVDDIGRGWPDFETALAGSEHADYTVLLAHAPLAARFVRDDQGVDLVLSGHTHGGQIRLPLLWRLLVPGFRDGYVMGLYGTPWGHVYVNRGFGGVGFTPLRVACAPEVTVIEVSAGG